MRRVFQGRGGGTLAFVLGLLIATAGTATAAKLITGKQIKDGSISAKDLSTSLRGQIARTGSSGPAGPSGPKGEQGPSGTQDGYTREVADARFVRGGGSTGAAADVLAVSSQRDGFLVLPGLGRVNVACYAGPAVKTSFENTSPDALRLTERKVVGGQPPLVVDLQLLPLTGLAAEYFAPGTVQFDLQLARGSGSGAQVANLVITAVANPVGATGSCRFSAQYWEGASG